MPRIGGFPPPVGPRGGGFRLSLNAFRQRLTALARRVPFPPASGGVGKNLSPTKVQKLIDTGRQVFGNLVRKWGIRSPISQPFFPFPPVAKWAKLQLPRWVDVQRRLASLPSLQPSLPKGIGDKFGNFISKLCIKPMETGKIWKDFQTELGRHIGGADRRPAGDVALPLSAWQDPNVVRDAQGQPVLLASASTAATTETEAPSTAKAAKSQAPSKTASVDPKLEKKLGKIDWGKLKTLKDKFEKIKDISNKARALYDIVKTLSESHSTMSPGEQIEALKKLFDAVRTLMPYIPGVGEFLDNYSKAMDTIANAVDDIAKRIRESEQGRAVLHPGAYPGGWSLYNYMLKVSEAGGDPNKLDPVPDAVVAWVKDNHWVLSLITGEEPPVRREVGPLGLDILAPDVDSPQLRERLKAWFIRNFDKIKDYVYGKGTSLYPEDLASGP